MHDYGLTPGLWDIIGGTYGLAFVNRNAVAAAIEAPVCLAPATVREALRAMASTHPVLRMSLSHPTDPRLCRQVIAGVDDAVARAILVHDDDAPEAPDALQARMTHHVAAVADRLDVAAGVTWGVAHLTAGATHHLVFVFNHVVCDLLSASQFIRTFVCSTESACERPAPPDTYLEHLRIAGVDLDADDGAATSWWHARPWAHIGEVPGIEPGRTGSSGLTTWVDVLDEGITVTEHRLIHAIDQGLRDVTSLTTTRIDSAVHGRGSRVTRTAGGWISHAVPYLAAPGEGAPAVESTRRRAGTWPSAFASVRARPDLPMDVQLRAHAFVNFFGSLDPRRWSHDGYRLSAVQPDFEPAGRASLTPLRLRVNSVNRRWVATWTVSESFTDRHGVAKEVAERALKNLASMSA